MTARIDIARIVQDVDPVYFRVRPWAYEDQADRFRKQTGIELPSRARAKEIGDFERLRVLVNRVTTTVECENGAWFQYRTHPGFMWDGASVPQIARWVIDDNDIYMETAAMVHDCNYGAHFLGDSVEAIEETNELFRAMIAYLGKPARARVAYWAVDSVIGHGIYQKMPHRRAPMTRRFVEFTSSNPNHCHNLF